MTTMICDKAARRIQLLNRVMVQNIINQLNGQEFTAYEIGKKYRVHQSYVNRIISEMLAAGLIENRGLRMTTPGRRRSKLYAVKRNRINEIVKAAAQ